MIKEQKANIFVTRLAGVSYEGRQQYVEKITADTPLLLKREPQNPYDANAIAVYACFDHEEQKIGYIPKVMAQAIAERMDAGEFVFVQFLEKKSESYNGVDYEKGEWTAWEFIGVVVGIMC